MSKGRIIKQISNFYTVLVDDKIYDCRSCGKFRLDKMSPVVGDIVNVDLTRKYIIDILPRKNYILRPTISNIDLCLIVTALKEPDLSLNLLDKQLCNLFYNKIKPVIVLTKIDLLTKKELKEYNNIFKYYEKIGINVFYNTELEKLEKYLSGKVVALTGQSGAGKSTLINKIGNINLKTAEISKALGRGKHTTRHTEIHQIKDFWLADTPGFSSLDITNIKKQELKNTFIEFNNYQCKFKDCIHYKEIDCGVKKEVGKEILLSRYEDYCKFLEELK